MEDKMKERLKNFLKKVSEKLHKEIKEFPIRSSLIWGSIAGALMVLVMLPVILIVKVEDAKPPVERDAIAGCYTVISNPKPLANNTHLYYFKVNEIEGRALVTAEHMKNITIGNKVELEMFTLNHFGPWTTKFYMFKPAPLPPSAMK